MQGEGCSVSYTPFEWPESKKRVDSLCNKSRIIGKKWQKFIGIVEHDHEKTFSWSNSENNSLKSINIIDSDASNIDNEPKVRPSFEEFFQDAKNDVEYSVDN